MVPSTGPDGSEFASLKIRARGMRVTEHLRFERILGILYIGTRLAQRASAKGILLAALLTEQTADTDVLDKAHFVSKQSSAF